MSKRIKYTAEEKYQIIREYQEGLGTLSDINGIYGYRRLKRNSNKKFGKKFNHKRIYRLIKIAGLESVIRRKKKRYVKSTPQYIAENILNRDFNAQNP